MIASRERAADFSDAALQLDAIYRELVTPQIARLREIEQMASELEGKLTDGADTSREIDAELRELALAVRAAGLEDILQVLMNGEAMDNEAMDNEAMDNEAMDNEAMGGLSGRVRRAADLLRQRIQQKIIRDIATDRDAPVPPQFRSLVDRYFQVLSGAILETEYVEAKP